MQTNYFDDAHKLATHIDSLANPATSWENLNLSDLDKLIKNNMRLILKQTENSDIAPKLQKSLFDLSKRMEKEQKFDTPEGHNLAFEVTSVAMGIFTDPKDPPKPDWTDLPKDVLGVIFSQNLPKNSDKSGLESSMGVSNEWKENAELVKKSWSDQGMVSLSTYGCSDSEEAVQCVIDKNLSGANLWDFDRITDVELTKLIKSCPNLNYLILNGAEKINEFPLEKLTNLITLRLVMCNKISHRVFSEGLKKLTQLTTLDLSYCQQFNEIDSLKELSKLTHLSLCQCKTIPGDELVEVLKQLSKLTYLNLCNCKQIPGDKLTDALKNFSQLTYLNLGDCKQIPEAKLAEALKNFSQLTHLDLSFCSQLSGDDELVEAFKNLSQLTDLNLRGCNHIRGDKLAGAIKNLSELTTLDLKDSQMQDDDLAEGLQNLSQLTHLDLSMCQNLTGVTLDQVLKKLPQLKKLDLDYCTKIPTETVKMLQKQYPNIKISFWEVTQS